jgi:hypothetical protein
MSSRSERGRARARACLQLETPITDDASLLAWKEEAAAIVRDANSRSGPNELPSTVLEEIARSYFRHVHRKR